MTKQSEVFSDSIAIASRDTHPETSAFSSGAVLKASVIAPRDIIDGLPEELIRWLHEDLDRKTVPNLQARRASQVDFESIVVDRLFPLRDSRKFTHRLREHCKATAVAAGLMAKNKGLSKRAAIVCGWLHDLGIASCIKHADEVSPIDNEEALSVVWPTIVRSSAQHAIRQASRWRLPSAIRHAIRDHSSFLTVGSPSPIVAATFIAEHIAAIIGFDFHEPAESAEVTRAMAILQLAERDVLSLASGTEKLLSAAPSVDPSLLHAQSRTGRDCK